MGDGAEVFADDRVVDRSGLVEEEGVQQDRVVYFVVIDYDLIHHEAVEFGVPLVVG